MPSLESNGTVPSLKQAKARAFILRHVAVYALGNPPPGVSAEVFARWSEEERVSALRQAEVDRETFWALLGPLRAELSPRETPNFLSVPTSPRSYRLPLLRPYHY